MSKKLSYMPLTKANLEKLDSLSPKEKIKPSPLQISDSPKNKKISTPSQKLSSIIKT
jgi:hypothetical protein